MARVVGDIAVSVGADVGPLQRDMKSAGRSVKSFEENAVRMGTNVAKAGAAVVTAMAAVATGVLAAAGEAAKAAVEIKNLAAVAGTGTTEFQRMAAASLSVGIEQEKLSDILKDVNDKVGDFLETGGGPMADFFENIAPKVGVTADEFARLSGPEALQLYVTSLEQAGVSQAQMTFYMEALASDATALTPLLRDNGKAMAQLGDEAERAGRILSEDAIAGAAELDAKLKELTGTLKTQATAAILEHQETLVALVTFITDSLIPSLSKLTDTMGEVAAGWVAIGEAANNAIAPLARAVGLMEQQSAASQTPENAAAAAEDVARTNAMGGGDVSSTGAGYINEAGEWVAYGTDQATPEEFGINRGQRVYSGRGSSAGPSAEDALAAFIENRKSELEAQQEANAALEEEEERHGSARAVIAEKTAEDLARIAELERAANFQSVAGAFGDVASLMQSENKKLFKIGQAAAIAEATVSSYQAAVSAWKKGMEIGGPPLATAFAAASAVKTTSLINQIKGASSTGGSGGSVGSGGGVGGSTSGGQGPLEVTFSGISPDELVSGASVSNLLERLSEEAGDRGFTFLGQPT